jgi:hypothetical protein
MIEMNKLAIYTLPGPGQDDDDAPVILIEQGKNEIVVSSNSKEYVDFYLEIIPESFIFKQVNKDKMALRRIVSSMYGGNVLSVEEGDLPEEEFTRLFSAAKHKKTIKL